jgi:hypothetical protein
VLPLGGRALVALCSKTIELAVFDFRHVVTKTAASKGGERGPRRVDVVFRRVNLLVATKAFSPSVPTTLRSSWREPRDASGETETRQKEVGATSTRETRMTRWPAVIVESAILGIL